MRVLGMASSPLWLELRRLNLLLVSPQLHCFAAHLPSNHSGNSDQKSDPSGGDTPAAASEDTDTWFSDTSAEAQEQRRLEQLMEMQGWGGRVDAIVAKAENKSDAKAETAAVPANKGEKLFMNRFE